MANKRKEAKLEALKLLIHKKGFGKKLKLSLAKKKLRFEKEIGSKKKKRAKEIKERRSKKGSRNVFEEIVDEFNIDGLKE